MAGVTGSFELWGKHCLGRITYEEVPYPESNTSDLWINLELYDSLYTAYYRLGGTITAGGMTAADFTGGGTMAYTQKGTYQQAFNGHTGPIAHGADGTLPVTISVNISGTDTAGHSNWAWSMTGGKTVALTTFQVTPAPPEPGPEPPALEPTAFTGVSTAYIGEACTITLSRKSPSCTHTINYGFGTLTGNIVSNSTADVISFTLPTSFYSQIPGATSGVGVMECVTYSGGTVVGSSSIQFTALVKNSEPTVSGAVTDANAATVALTGDANKLVRYASTAACTITAAAKNSASIVSKSIAGQAVSGNTRSIPKVETGSFVFSVRDSRGYTASATVTKTLVAYVPLTCNGTVTRTAPTASTAVLKLSGNYFAGSFGKASNTLTVSYSVNGGAAVSASPAVSGGGWSVSVQLSGLVYTSAHTVTVTAKDALGSVSRTLTLTRGVPVFDFGKDSFSVNVPLDVTGGFGSAGKKAIVDLIYPVGAIYMSLSATSPASLFGGTWTQITGRFLLAAGGGYTAGGTGGAATHTHAPGTLQANITLAENGVWQEVWPATSTGPFFTANWRYDQVYAAATACNMGGIGTPTKIGGATAAANGMPPYYVVYMWRRTA